MTTPTTTSKLREVEEARKLFKAGDRVVYEGRWHGVVTGEPDDDNICWCRFDEVGQFGADPRKLRHAYITLRDRLRSHLTQDAGEE